MIPLRNISACDNCGVCCQRAPCLLGSFAEVRAIETKVGSIRDSLRVEKRADGRMQVRISNAPCRFHVGGLCSIHDVKPQGGREFKCWDARTYGKVYGWTANQLRKIGFHEAA